MAERFTLAEALFVLDAMERNVAHLIGVANVDVADVYGGDAANDRAVFLHREESGGDRPTIYARRLARMLIERMIQEYDIAPRAESTTQADGSTT